MIEDSEFRRVMGHFATGVAVVTTLHPDGRPCGATVSAVSAVSLAPTLLLVCLDHASESNRALAQFGSFAVNVLAEGTGEALARRFAGKEDKFQGVRYRREITGAPVLNDALAWMECRVVQALPTGDHTIYVGEVMAADAYPGTPLVYYRGGYGRLGP
jgi:flavin reductase (DIM6/NTAB) family NADH-FMN oxidoreductase RutF